MVKFPCIGNAMRLTTIMFIWACATVFVTACAQTAPPLSITLRDPKTNAVQKCSAREGAAKDSAALSSAVEACARQLEARGFVREND